MAEISGLRDLYDLFYFHASAIHHANPMGLTMLTQPDTLDVKPAPQLAHIAVGLGIAVVIIAEGIRSYASLHGMDCEETLRSAEQKVDEHAKYDLDVVGAIAELFPS
jgi:hypothetical protein